MSFQGRRWRWTAPRDAPTFHHRAQGIRYPMAPISRNSKRIKKLEKGITGKERKIIDFGLVATALTPAGLVTYLSGVAQGDTSVSREGLRINLLSMQLKFYFHSDFAQVNRQASHKGRLLIFVDTMNQGALPAVTDVLEAANCLAFKEHENMRRFRTLYNKVFRVPHAGWEMNTLDVIIPWEGNKQINYYKKFKKPLKVEFTGVGNLVNDAGRNAIFALWLCADAQDTPIGQIQCRMRFTE